MDLPNPSQMKAFAYPNNIYRQNFLKLKIIYLPKVKKTIQSLFFKFPLSKAIACFFFPAYTCKQLSRTTFCLLFFRVLLSSFKLLSCGYMSRKFRRKRKEQEIADGFYDEVRRKENSAEKFFGKVGRGEISHETTEQWDE